MSAATEIDMLSEADYDFDALLMQLHNQIVSESISDVYSGHSRCEKLATVNGVTYYNDSLSTSIKDALDALKFISEKKVVWIMNESDDINGLHKLSKTITEKIVSIICIGDHTSQTMLKLLDYSKIVLGASTTIEAVELSHFFISQANAVIFSPGSPIFPKLELHQDQGHLFKKAVKTIELNREKKAAA